jgi:hypothetical protein
MTISFSIYDACYRERAKCNKTARPAVLGIITTQSLGPPLVTYDAQPLHFLLLSHQNRNGPKFRNQWNSRYHEKKEKRFSHR